MGDDDKEIFVMDMLMMAAVSFYEKFPVPGHIIFAALLAQAEMLEESPALKERPEVMAAARALSARWLKTSPEAKDEGAAITSGDAN